MNGDAPTRTNSALAWLGPELTFSGNPTLDLEMPLCTPRAATRASTLREGDAADIRLHHHAVKGLVYTAARFQDRGHGAAAPEFGDHQVDVTHLGGQAAWAVAIAGSRDGPHCAGGLRHRARRQLQLDQLLQAVAYDLRDQLPCCAAIE